jgi:hypothetical protein
MTEFLHVANGTSTTMTIEAARIPGAVSIWADPLHDGPVPGHLSDDELLEVRARHLADPNDAASLSETIAGLKEWRRVIAAHDAYRELVLWYEHDLFDQLNLIQLLSWIDAHLPRSTRVSLICIDSFPGRPTFRGLGELTTSELAPLLAIRQPVTDAQYALAGRAWRAFGQPTPEALDDLCRTDTSALPFLGAALGRFLQEYPWTSDGLSRRERRLLELARDGGTSLAAAFPHMDQGETAFYVSDVSLSDTADDLSATSPPLLAVSAGEGLRRTATITDAGRDVLAGRRDRVGLCGIDRWLGGVHLQPGNLWRWDDESQRISAA